MYGFASIGCEPGIRILTDVAVVLENDKMMEMELYLTCWRMTMSLVTKMIESLMPIASNSLELNHIPDRLGSDPDATAYKIN